MTRPALQFVADTLNAALRPNMGPLTTYLVLINYHTYADSSTPIVVQIPAIPAQATPPSPLSPPPSTGDPYADAAKRAAVTQANARAMATYQRTLAQQDAALAHVRAEVTRQTDAVRKLRLVVDDQGADVYGCVAKASERFGQTTGARFLIIASDLRNDIYTDALPPRDLALRGAIARVVLFPCATAAACQARRAAWTRYLLAAGASSVTFYDPAVTGTLPLATFFDAGTS